MHGIVWYNMVLCKREERDDIEDLQYEGEGCVICLQESERTYTECKERFM